MKLSGNQYRGLDEAMSKYRTRLGSYLKRLGWGAILATSAFGQLAAQEPQGGASKDDGALGSTLTLEELRNGGKPKPKAEEVSKARLITAAPEPVPALRYRFWPAEQDLKAGDAKVFFFRTAVSFNSAEREKQLDEYFNKWEEAREAGQEVPAQEIRNALEPYRLQFDELETMSLCDHQDLDMQLRDLRGSDVYMILLEEVQVARSIARLLRWRMAEQAAAGDWDGFVRTTRTGYRLAKLISTGDTLIHSLVGIAITGIITEEVQRAAQHKGCPNFYWALASLPRPMFDLRPALELETSIVGRVFPFLSECRQGPLPEAVVQEKWEAMQKSLLAIDSNVSAASSLVGALSIDKAKANLLERGWKEESFKDYPVMQLVLIDLDDTMREKGDMAMKYFLLPDDVAEDARKRENEALEKWLKENTTLANFVARTLFPAITQVSNAAKRTEHALNGAMNKEAIRMHVSKHGTLPASLDQLDVVPALRNPYTNKPFELVVKPTQMKNMVEVTIQGEVTGIPQQYVTWVTPFLIEINSEK